jgi:putative flippase GtrA
VAKLARYMGASVVANATTLTVLGVLVGVLDFDAGWSNVIATAVATIPSFELNRRWVWHRDGRSSWGREVIPFWVWAFLELGISSLAVHLMGLHATAAGWSRPVRTGALEATTIGTTGALWIVQFFLFDRVLFRRRDRRAHLRILGSRPPAAVPPETAAAPPVDAADPQPLSA